MGAKTALIFGSIACDNWDFLQPLRSLAPVVICADGGLLCAKAAGFAPDFYIGDGDSGGSLPDGCPGVVLPAEKDETDLQAACRLAAQQGCTSLLLTACTGGRRTISGQSAVAGAAEKGGAGGQNSGCMQ